MRMPFCRSSLKGRPRALRGRRALEVARRRAKHLWPNCSCERMILPKLPCTHHVHVFLCSHATTTRTTSSLSQRPPSRITLSLGVGVVALMPRRVAYAIEKKAASSSLISSYPSSSTRTSSSLTPRGCHAADPRRGRRRHPAWDPTAAAAALRRPLAAEEEAGAEAAAAAVVAPWPSVRACSPPSPSPPRPPLPSPQPSPSRPPPP